MQQTKRAIFLADLGFGDAGKGTITDFLTRQHRAHTIIRYNGGPQAAHNVVTPDGKQHTFAQFGSGMFLPWTKTFLSRFMLINPLNMLSEARHLCTLGVTDALERTQIDRQALIISPYQKSANRLQEIARGDRRHGSCGEGIGECMADNLKYGNIVLRAGDLQDRATIRQKLRLLRVAKYTEIAELIPQLPSTIAVQQEIATFINDQCLEDCIDVYRYFADHVEIIDTNALHTLLAQTGTILFEGAQGVLLDENFAFAPYSTWSTTTFANADTLLQEHDYEGEVTRLGIVRTYATRHGAGPFPTEDTKLTAQLPEAHNAWNDWQQRFRVGHFDLLLTNYARSVVGKLDGLVVTHLDRLATLPEWKICTAYNTQAEPQALSDYFEHNHQRVTAIRLHQPVDLLHQERLTHQLKLCTPEYQILTPPSGQHFSRHDYHTYLSILAERLATPVLITSNSNTATGKCFHQTPSTLIDEKKTSTRDIPTTYSSVPGAYTM